MSWTYTKRDGSIMECRQVVLPADACRIIDTAAEAHRMKPATMMRKIILDWADLVLDMDRPEQ